MTETLHFHMILIIANPNENLKIYIHTTTIKGNEFRGVFSSFSAAEF